MESRVETGGNGRTKRAQVGTEGNHMFCTACGSQLPGGALFCSRCGNKVAGMQQPQITEFYHGTSVEAAMSIQATGFDVSRSGSNAGAMLGPGLYVTTTLQKALTYATYMSRWQERYDVARGHCLLSNITMQISFFSVPEGSPLWALLFAFHRS